MTRLEIPIDGSSPSKSVSSQQLVESVSSQELVEFDSMNFLVEGWLYVGWISGFS